MSKDTESDKNPTASKAKVSPDDQSTQPSKAKGAEEKKTDKKPIADAPKSEDTPQLDVIATEDTEEDPDCPKVISKQLKEAAEELKKNSDEIKKATKKPSKLRQVFNWVVHKPVLIASLIAGGIGGYSVNYLMEDGHGKDMLFGQFSVEESSALHIHGSGSSSVYTEVGNRFSRSLNNIGYGNYGFGRPSPGSQTSLLRLSPELDEIMPNTPFNFAEAQNDVLIDMQSRDEIPYIRVIFNMESVPECALMASKDRYENFGELIADSEYRAALKADGTDVEPIRIASIRQGSGSYVTTRNIIGAALDADVIEFQTYNNPESAVQAVSEGRADVSVFVEYPGRAQGRFQNGLRAIFNSDLTLMELGQAQYQSRFADHPGQYSLLQPTIESELTMNPYTWYSAWEDQTISLPSMLCTHLVIAGRTPESIENTALRENYIRPMQQDVLSQVNPDRLQPSTSTRFLNLSK